MLSSKNQKNVSVSNRERTLEWEVGETRLCKASQAVWIFLYPKNI